MAGPQGHIGGRFSAPEDVDLHLSAFVEVQTEEAVIRHDYMVRLREYRVWPKLRRFGYAQLEQTILDGGGNVGIVDVR